MRHQREENQRLQVLLNLYREEEAVTAESRTPVTPPPGIPTLTLNTQQHELMLALVQSMSLPLPEVGARMVMPKPTAPMPAGASWDLMTDPDTTRLQADLEAVKAAEEAERQQKQKE